MPAAAAAALRGAPLGPPSRRPRAPDQIWCGRTQQIAPSLSLPLLYKYGSADICRTVLSSFVRAASLQIPGRGPGDPSDLGLLRARNVGPWPRSRVARQCEEKEATTEERVAEAITRFTGSMRFVYLRLAFFDFWIGANLGWAPGVPAEEPRSWSWL
jgi:hypothetical protein